MAYLSEWGIPIFRIDPGPTGLDAFGDFVTGLPIDIFGVASGGASAGGAATADAVAGASASGGAAAGGAANLSGGEFGDLAAAGGGQAGGSATLAGSFMAGDISASGGAEAGGSAHATATTPPDTAPPEPEEDDVIVSAYVMDLLAMYADVGQVVRLRPVAGPVVDGAAILDAPGTSLVGEILATDYSMRFPVETFSAVRKGDQIISGGVTYTARQSSQPISIDGLEHVVPLSR